MQQNGMASIHSVIRSAAIRRRFSYRSPHSQITFVNCVLRIPLSVGLSMLQAKRAKLSRSHGTFLQGAVRFPFIYSCKHVEIFISILLISICCTKLFIYDSAHNGSSTSCRLSFCTLVRVIKFIRTSRLSVPEHIWLFHSAHETNDSKQPAKVYNFKAKC